MLLAAEVRMRLAAEVEGLAGRVIGATDLATLMAQNRLPQVTPAAAVLPAGMRGGAALATMGAFSQAVERRVGVLLVLRAAAPATQRGSDDIETLAEAVLAALAGWTPDEQTPGVLRLTTAELRSMIGGTILYEMHFALGDAAEFH